MKTRGKLLLAFAIANLGLTLSAAPARAGDATQYNCDKCIGGAGQQFNCCVEEACGGILGTCCSKATTCNGGAS